MQIIWRMEKAFAKEVREAIPDPKPHINTVATTLQRMAGKGYLSYEDFGTTYRYWAAISKTEYTRKFVRPVLNSFFGNSIKNAVAFFAEEEEISASDLKEIMDMIEKKKSK